MTEQTTAHELAERDVKVHVVFSGGTDVEIGRGSGYWITNSIGNVVAHITESMLDNLIEARSRKADHDLDPNLKLKLRTV